MLGKLVECDGCFKIDPLNDPIGVVRGYMAYVLGQVGIARAISRQIVIPPGYINSKAVEYFGLPFIFSVYSLVQNLDQGRPVSDAQIDSVRMFLPKTEVPETLYQKPTPWAHRIEQVRAKNDCKCKGDNCRRGLGRYSGRK